MSGTFFLNKNREILETYWELVRIIVPVAIVTQCLIEIGVIDALAPTFEPIMNFYGLPPELAFAWLTGLLVGVWGALVVIFTLVPVSEFSIADMTVFSALLLFAHALPVEQKIIQRAGPGFIATTILRLLGGMFYAWILHQIFSSTNLLAGPIDPSLIPTSSASGWSGFFISMIETLVWMLIILAALAWLMEFLNWSGVTDWLKKGIEPIFRYAGIQKEASQMVAIGLLLGISFGGGMLIREAKKGHINPRQIFLSCVFMGFAHSVIEDTLIVVAMGADLTSVLIGRIVFAIAATGLIAVIMRYMSDAQFHTFAYATPPSARE